MPPRRPEVKEMSAWEDQEKSSSFSKSGKARIVRDCRYSASISLCRDSGSTSAVHVVKEVHSSRQLCKAHGRKVWNVDSLIFRGPRGKQHSMRISSMRNPRYTAVDREVTVLCRP